MYDVIVIGSGIGGLAAAGLLARVAGKRVLVLEKHSEPGGLTHTFRRDGASWDVGVHYIGQLEPGGLIRSYFDYLSGGELEWVRMPDHYDRFVYPGLDFPVPSGQDAYQQRLTEAFPSEARAIRRYFRDIRRAARWAMLRLIQVMAPHPVASVARGLQRITGRMATRTTQDYLKRRFRSPRLRALVASQWGDYGLPPSRSPFVVHAGIVRHYLDGAWFPEGGSSRIARTFEKGIEQAGGAVRVSQEVVEILVEDGAATGVRVRDHRDPSSPEVVHRAPAVISNAGAAITFGRLLPTEGALGQATAPVRSLIEGYGTGPSAVTVYLRLREDPRTIGVDGGNSWIYRDFDHDRSVAIKDERFPQGVFVSFPSVKSGERVHTAELISFLSASEFGAWQGTQLGNRGAGYSKLKKHLGHEMLRLAETAIPGLSDLVEYMEVSTPLTVEHYTSHPGGAFYGIPATPEYYRSKPTGSRTPVRGLYLSGQDVFSLGVGGAMMGGVLAASQVLGPKGFLTIQSALKQGPSPVLANWPLPPGKHHATLIVKRRLTPSVWEAVFRIEGEVGKWAPGQFARLHVGNDAWRDYSIAGIDGDQVRFLISTRTGGQGSRFVEDAPVGARTQVELPLGQFTLAADERRRVFVATCCGLALFLPMFEHTSGEDMLLFGCRTRGEDLTALLDAPLPSEVIRCITREPVADAVQGRVTQVLRRMDVDAGTGFYLCGSSAMVADARMVLESRGVSRIHAELY